MRNLDGMGGSKVTMTPDLNDVRPPPNGVEIKGFILFLGVVPSTLFVR